MGTVPGSRLQSLRLRRGGLTILLAVLAPSLGLDSARAQEMPVPMETQASLLYRIVQFDRAFEARSEGGLTVGILFQASYPVSVEAKEEFSTAVLAEDFRDAGGNPVDIVEVKAEQTVGRILDEAGVDLLHVAPVRGVDLRGLSAETRRQGILTLSGVPDYAREGLAVSLDVQGGRPRILINLDAAVAERSDFRPALLKMAQIIGGGP